MADLAPITEKLIKQNQEELAKSVKDASASLQSAGARQALTEISSIFEEQSGVSVKEFKQSRDKITALSTSLDEMDTVSNTERKILEDILKSSQASIKENANFKKSIGELTSNAVKSGLDGVGGMLTGALAQSPILALGASFLGDRVKQFRERRAAAKEEENQRIERIKQETEIEKKEFEILRTQISNEDAISRSNMDQQKIQEEARSRGVSEQTVIDEVKDNIIRTAKNEKLSNDAKKAELDAIEDLKKKYEIETEVSKPESPTENFNDNISTPETTETDTNALLDIDEKLGPNQAYLEEIRDLLQWMKDNDGNPTSLEIEEARELRRERKKTLEIEKAQLKAMQATGAGGLGISSGKAGGNEGSLLDTVGDIGGGVAALGGLAAAFKVFKKGGFTGLIKAVPALMGLSTAMDVITPDRASSIDGPDGRDAAKTRKAKPRGRFGRIFDFAKRNLKKVNPKLLLGGAAAATAVGATTTLIPSNDTSTPKSTTLTPSNDIDTPKSTTLIPSNDTSTPKSAKPRSGSGGLGKAKELISKKTQTAVAAASAVATKAATPVKSAASTINKKLAKTILAKRGAMMAAKAIPAVGAIVGAGFALGRLFRGDFVGAAAEAGGIIVPGPFSAVIDIPIMVRDTYNDMYGTEDNRFPFESDGITKPEIFKERTAALTKMAKEMITGTDDNIEKHNKDASEVERSNISSEITDMEGELETLSNKSRQNRGDRRRMGELKRNIEIKKNRLAEITPEPTDTNIDNSIQNVASTQAEQKLQVANAMTGNALDNQASAAAANVVVAPTTNNSTNVVNNNSTTNTPKPEVRHTDMSIRNIHAGIGAY